MTVLYTALLVILISGVSFTESVLATPLLTLEDHKPAGKQKIGIRCWYRIDASVDNPATRWEWARTPQGDVYQIEGYWHSSDIISNMFYTDTHQSDIQNICESTLAHHHTATDILFFAANDDISINYPVWTNDEPDTEGINKIISFGDSLSDTGNSFNGSHWAFPNANAWFIGHFTNGWVWTEYLAKAKNIPLYNWAIGGSAGSDQCLPLGGQQCQPIKGVVNQIHSYLDYVKLAQHYSPDNTLFTLEFGLNDFTFYKRPLESVKNDMDEALQLLAAANAKNIILMLLPDSTKTPGFKYRSQEEITNLQNTIIAYNSYLKEKIREYRKKGIIIVGFDAWHLLEQLIESPETYGFVNTEDACLDIQMPNVLSYLKLHPLTIDCKATGSGKYVFWDFTHPTTHAYQYFANDLINNTLTSFSFTAH